MWCLRKGVWGYWRMDVWWGWDGLFVYLFFFMVMKSVIKSYRELETWQEAMNLVENIYEITKALPSEEMYGLKSQIRRSAVSIPSNIAEGHGRKGIAEYLHHLSIARGSLAELETQLILCVRLHYITSENMKPIWVKSQTVGKLLTGLVRSLAKK